MEEFEWPFEVEVGLIGVFTALWAFMFLCVVFGVVS